MPSGPESSHVPPPAPLTGVAAALFRGLLPYAEHDEVLADLAAEHADRVARHGRVAARLWLWRQLLGSLPSLLHRTWWRGWTGFEPHASRWHTGGPVLETLIVDARYSARRLASRPGYLVVAALTLALGAGGTAAIFGMVRTLLLDPLPVTREADIGVLWMDKSWTEEEFLSLRPDVPGFQRMAVYVPQDATLEVPGQPLRLVRGISSSAELFDVLGAPAAIGRTLTAGDDLPGAEPVAVLSHRFWQDLGGDRSLVGRQLRLGGISRTIVGVMPPAFWFPSPEIGVWTSAPLSPENRAGKYTLIGRIDGSARMDHMGGPLGAIAAELGRRFDYPAQWDKTRSPSITPLREHIVGDVRPALVATFVAMCLILAMACVNISALMLGQVGGRSTELALRTALGAGRRRLLQQLVVESALVGVVAGPAGAVVGGLAFQVLVNSLPLGALAENATLDWTVFWAATGVALLSATMMAAIPGVVVWRSDPRESLGVRSNGVQARGGRLEGALVVVQIALAVLLTTAAGLMIRSVVNLRAIDPGLRVEGIAVVDTTLPTELSNDERRRAVLDALPSLQALPIVRAAAATMKLPLRGTGQNWGIGIEGRPELDGTTTAVRIVSHDYFETLGIAVRRGRGFLPSDRDSTERVVVINEALASKYFGGGDPIGRIVHTGFDDHGERVVGVVQNVAEASLTDPAMPARYMLYDQVPFLWHETTFVLLARNVGDLPQVVHAARSTLQRDSRQLAVQRTITMQSVFEDALGAPRQLAPLLSMLGALALVLGAVGVYGMINHFVVRRTREYAIRMAVGLPPARVVSQVLGRGVRLIGAGSLLGIAAALALSRWLTSLLYGVGTADPAAAGGAVLALLLAGSLAAYVPARRASRTDPLSVLREQ